MGDDAGMADDPLLDRARTLWVDLARVPVVFPTTGTSVVVAPDSWLCPAGWVGVVAGDLAGRLALVPDAIGDPRLAHDPVDEPPAVGGTPGPLHHHELDATEA